MICSGTMEDWNDTCFRKNWESDEVRTFNCSSNMLSESDVHEMSARNEDGHNRSTQKKCFMSTKCQEFKRKKITGIRTSKGITFLTGIVTLYIAYEIASVGFVFVLSWPPAAKADFSDNCPSDCNCKWANGKREADCTRGGFTTIPTNLDHEIQILRMTHNYVRKLGKNVFHSTGLINLQRIFMNHCHVQV